MGFTLPTPVELRARLAAELAALPGADSGARRSVEEVLARTLALAAQEQWGYLGWIARQVNVLTCDADTVLSVHAPLWGIARIPAAAATGAVTFTGSVGMVVPAGTELRRSDDRRYVTAADATIAGGGTAAATVTATVPGLASNALAGVALALLSPIAGVTSQAVVAVGGLSGGAEVEGLESLRARVVARIQEPPHGGREHDYIEWAREVPDITRVWVYPLWLGLGTVGVTFLCDNRADPLPEPADVAAVAAHIDGLRPVTAGVTVFAPVRDLVPVTVALSPDTAAVRAAVTAEIVDFFLREAVPGGTLYHSRLGAAISAAAGEDHHALTLPAANVVSAPGHIARLGTLTFA